MPMGAYQTILVTDYKHENANSERPSKRTFSQEETSPMPRNRPRPYGCKSQEVYWVNTGTCGQQVFRGDLHACRLEGRLFIGKSKKQVYRSKSVVIEMRRGHEWFPLTAWVSATVILFLSYRYPVLQSTCFVDVLSY